LQHDHRADAVLSIDPRGAAELRFGSADRPATAPMGRQSAATLYIRTADRRDDQGAASDVRTIR
jgi:hypothetical protein